MGLLDHGLDSKVNRPLLIFSDRYILGPMQIIQDYLRVMGISQAEFARRAGMDPSALNDL